MSKRIALIIVLIMVGAVFPTFHAIITPKRVFAATTSNMASQNPFSWNYNEVKALDPAGDEYKYNDGSDEARDLIAFYYAAYQKEIVMRIDVLNLKIGDENNANWYILMDYKSGGSTTLPDDLQGSTSMAWDVAVAIYSPTDYKVYLPGGSTINNAVINVTFNAEYDFVVVALNATKLPDFSYTDTVHFQVLSAKDFANPYRVADSIPNSLQDSISSNDHVGTAKVAFVQHANQHIGYSASVVCGGLGTGYDDVIRVHLKYHVPLNLHLSGVLMENLLWNNYTCGSDNFIAMIRKGINEGLISILTSAYGQQIMPFFPLDLNIKSLQLEDELDWDLFHYTPTVAWVPERVWETTSSDPDPINGVKSNPWQYFTAINSANGKQYAYAVILDANTHGTGNDTNGNPVNPYKIYKLPGYNLKVLFIDDWLKDQIYASSDWDSEDWTQIKEHWLNLALSLDQQQVDIYADDMEKAAGVANWPTNPQDYFYAVKYVASHPWIQAVRLDQLITWDNGNWGVAGEYWPVPGTYSEIGGTSGYGGTSSTLGRNAWYKDWAKNYYPYNCNKPAGALWWDAYQELENLKNAGVSNNLVQLSWITLIANLYETGWHDSMTGPISGWEKDITAHLRHALVYAYGAWWLNEENKPLLAYWKNVDDDKDNEIVLQNNKLYAVLDPIGGRIGWIFDNKGNTIMGNSMALWSGTEGDYNDGNHVWALSDAYSNGTYANDYYQLRIIDNGSDGKVVVAAKSPAGFTKYLILKQGWPYIEVVYRNVSQRLYVKAGWSPGVMDMLLNGKQHISRVWLYNGKVAGYYNTKTGTLAAFVYTSPVSFNTGQDWMTLAIKDEITFDTDAKFYIYAGSWNSTIFGHLINQPLAGKVWSTPQYPLAGDTITIYYNASGGPLQGSTSITMHWGHNYWKNITDTKMTEVQRNIWEATIKTYTGWRTIDMAFTNGKKWDNNAWRNFHIALTPQNIPKNVEKYLSGDVVAWGTYLPAPDTGTIYNGEFVWNDPSGDTHSSNDYPLKKSNYDITAIRVRSDNTYVYFMIRLANLTHVGWDGGPVIFIPISNTSQGKQTYLPYFVSTKYEPGWNYIIDIDLSNTSVKPGQILSYPQIKVLNSNFKPVIGNYYMIASPEHNVIEVAVPKKLLGIKDNMNFNVITVSGNGKGNSYWIGSSQVLDLMSPESTDQAISNGQITYSQSLDVTEVPVFSHTWIIIMALLAGIILLTRRMS